jgi:hypothetical protein
MAPVVLTELLSDPKLPPAFTETILGLPLIACTSGYWRRAGLLRAKLPAKRRKARFGDALIAQSHTDAVFLSSRAPAIFGHAQKPPVGLVIGFG